LWIDPTMPSGLFHIDTVGRSIAGSSKTIRIHARLQSVESGNASLERGVPKPLFPTRLELDSFQRQYDVSADEKRFLLAQPLEESASVCITLIVNWPLLLKK
jgi:hypothetical protein